MDKITKFKNYDGGVSLNDEVKDYLKTICGREKFYNDDYVTTTGYEMGVEKHERNKNKKWNVVEYLARVFK